MKPFSKTQKHGPFTLDMVGPDYPYFSTLLALAVSKVAELPDFSEDMNLGVFSDFGGEHAEAEFATYSVLIMSLSKVGPFQTAIETLRRKYNMIDPYSEFAYKKLSKGSRPRAIGDFLHIVDNFIHGALITVAIDKQLKTVFGGSKSQAHAGMTEQLASMGLGRWKGEVAEKAARVCHTICAFLALTMYPNQRVLWYCDNDSINQDASVRTFKNTQEIFVRVLGLYTQNHIDFLGFAKSFAEKSHYDDLLSVPDLAAGVVQDLLRSHKTGINQVPGGEEKATVMRWIANRSKFLSKITIQLVPLPDGQVGVWDIDFIPAASETSGTNPV
ncbi:hypothetical protein ACHFCA_34770 (plasmid) [Delftia tsuruhatensis]